VAERRDNRQQTRERRGRTSAGLDFAQSLLASADVALLTIAEAHLAVVLKHRALRVGWGSDHAAAAK